MSFTLHPDLQRDGILIGRFPLCLVLLINDANYPWFVLVPERSDLRDVNDLSDDDYQTLGSESREFGSGIMRAFAGEKLNVAALGNVTPQLHIHHIVRFRSDAAWPDPVWGKHPLLPYRDDGVKAVRQKLTAASIPGFRLTACPTGRNC